MVAMFSLIYTIIIFFLFFGKPWNRPIMKTIPDFLEDFYEMLFIFGSHAGEDFGPVYNLLGLVAIVHPQQFESRSIQGEAVIPVVDAYGLFHLGHPSIGKITLWIIKLLKLINSIDRILTMISLLFRWWTREMMTDAGRSLSSVWGRLPMLRPVRLLREWLSWWDRSWRISWPRSRPFGDYRLR